MVPAMTFFLRHRDSEINASAELPALRAGARRALPSCLLRFAAGFETPQPSGVNRGAVRYVRLEGSRSRCGTVGDWMRLVAKLQPDCDLYEVQQVMSAILGDDADAVNLEVKWEHLSDAERNAVDIAIGLSSRPSALLIDGRAASSHLELRILARARQTGVPVVWDGCAPSTVEAARCTTFEGFVYHPTKYDDDVTTRKGQGALVGGNSLMQWVVLLCALTCGEAAGGQPLQNLMHKVVTSNGAVDISWWRIGTLALVVGAVLVVSVVLELGIATQLMIASVRCFVQLSLLGLILVPIIRGNQPLLVLSYITLMIVIAGLEAAGRPPWVYPGLFWVCFGSVFVSVGMIGTFVFTVVIGTGLDAQYVIPILGMLMGSALSGVSVGVSATVRNVVEKSDSIEALLALGASRWEATRDVARNSIVLGLTNLLNSLSVVGLVSIPLVCSETRLSDANCVIGQIIGGTPPGLAARYQMVIMYSVCGSTCSSVVLSVMGTILCVTDRMHRVRLDRMVERKKSKKFFEVIADGFSNSFRLRRQFVSIPGEHLRMTRYGSVDAGGSVNLNTKV